LRRSEFFTEDLTVIEEVLATAVVGYLGIITHEGHPRVVPVNFASEKSAVYFHGALEGEKAEVIREGPQVTFHANVPYSVIPSYWLAQKHASGATMFFKSVQIDGRAVVLGDPQEKSRVLQLLMEKYQPEGGYSAVSHEDPMYQKPIAETLVVRVDPVRVAAKVKLGQNYPPATRQRIIQHLEERAEGPDLLTARQMKSLFSAE
jgi:nitroimidazol reductase NimA-like FMN-containing flavoprotein (pyridoxamine 5'-phosphate oxidase superfamily)